MASVLGELWQRSSTTWDKRFRLTWVVALLSAELVGTFKCKQALGRGLSAAPPGVPAHSAPAGHLLVQTKEWWPVRGDPVPVRGRADAGLRPLFAGASMNSKYNARRVPEPAPSRRPAKAQQPEPDSRRVPIFSS